MWEISHLIERPATILSQLYERRQIQPANQLMHAVMLQVATQACVGSDKGRLIYSCICVEPKKNVAHEDIAII